MALLIRITSVLRKSVSQTKTKKTISMLSVDIKDQVSQFYFVHLENQLI